MIVVFFLCLLAGTSLLVWNNQNVFLEIFASSIIAFPLLCFAVVFTIKAFTDPNFCRSERHLERMAKVEMLGSDKTSFSPLEIETTKLEPPTIEPREVRKLTDKKPRQSMNYFIMVFERDPLKSYTEFHEDLISHVEIKAWWHFRDQRLFDRDRAHRSGPNATR